LVERNDPGAGIAAETVLGLDNVPLDLPLAGVGSRVLAGFVDYMLQAVLQIVWFFAALTAGFSTGHGAAATIVFFLGAFLVDWAYFAGLEIAMHGRTPGKKRIGLRVVSREGGTAGRSALLTRNLLRPVDLFIGVPMMALDPLSRRLGDRLANTLVVYDRAPADEPAVRRIPKGWQAADVSLVESLLRRAPDLEPQRAEAMAHRILERVSRDDPAFLEGHQGGDGPLETLRRAFDVGTA
jgi:uncharacterized RDD family membrane protein YckC